MIVQFATLEGENKGPQIDVPLGSTVLQMEELMNQLLENKNKVRGDALSFRTDAAGYTNSEDVYGGRSVSSRKLLLHYMRWLNRVPNVANTPLDGSDGGRILRNAVRSVGDTS